MKLEKAEQLAIELMNKWDLLPEWDFEFDRAKSRFGACHGSQVRITLSKPLTKRNNRKHVRNTVLHEIAHALDYQGRDTTDHSERWKKWALKVGAKPERCYSREINSVQYKYFDFCPNCEGMIGRHRRNYKNKFFSCTRCGSKKNFSPDYLMLKNVPAELIKKILNGEVKWKETKYAELMVEHLISSDFYDPQNLFLKSFKSQQPRVADLSLMDS